MFWLLFFADSQGEQPSRAAGTCWKGKHLPYPCSICPYTPGECCARGGGGEGDLCYTCIHTVCVCCARGGGGGRVTFATLVYTPGGGGGVTFATLVYTPGGGGGWPLLHLYTHRGGGGVTFATLVYTPGGGGVLCPGGGGGRVTFATLVYTPVVLCLIFHNLYVRMYVFKSLVYVCMYIHITYVVHMYMHTHVSVHVYVCTL